MADMQKDCFPLSPCGVKTAKNSKKRIQRGFFFKKPMRTCFRVSFRSAPPPAWGAGIGDDICFNPSRTDTKIPVNDLTASMHRGDANKDI